MVVINREGPRAGDTVLKPQDSGHSLSPSGGKMEKVPEAGKKQLILKTTKTLRTIYNYIYEAGGCV